MSFVKPQDHLGCTIWLTGLSGSGKTTIARNTKRFLDRFNIPAVHLDGDTLRGGMNSDLGFSRTDRRENIRRVAELSVKFASEGQVALVSLISPYAEYRLAAREAHEKAQLRFFEVYVNTPIEICEVRDPKDLYKKARQGKIPEFTGVSAPYEKPTCPDLTIESGIYAIEACRDKVLRLLVDQQVIPSAILDPVDRHLDISQKIDLIENSKMLPAIKLDKLSLQWAQVIAEGWATPLEGFMRENELLECMHFKTLTANNMVHSQSIPIVLPITDEDKHRARGFESVVLKNQLNDKPVGLLTDIEIYEDRKKERCARTFGSVDEGHPTIYKIMNSKTQWLVGGKLQLFERVQWDDGLDKYRLKPSDIKNQLIQMKAGAVFVFQLRNPLHNGHVLLINETYNRLKDFNPVLLLHPIGGWTKDDDVPLSVRMKQHQVLLDEGVLDPARTILSIFPSPMLYAGPTEVQWHAKGRIVAGVDYYIVGRDPAGVKDPSEPTRDLYDPTHGAKILQKTPGLQCLKILPFRVAALNKKADKMEFLPSEINPADYELISGSRMRQMARDGQNPPKSFMHPKAWQVLADYYKSLQVKN